MEYKFITNAGILPSAEQIARDKKNLAELQGRTPKLALGFELWSFDAIRTIPARLIAQGTMSFDENKQPFMAYTFFFLRKETAPEEFFRALSETPRSQTPEEKRVRMSLLSIRNRLILLTEGDEIGWWRFYSDDIQRRAMMRVIKENRRLKSAHIGATKNQRVIMDQREMEANEQLLRDAEELSKRAGGHHKRRRRQH